MMIMIILFRSLNVYTFKIYGPAEDIPFPKVYFYFSNTIFIISLEDL